jgi:hypothetical protein
VKSLASAFDYRFTVLAKSIAFRPVGEHVFRFRDRLYDPDNRHDRVGRDRAKCRERRPHSFKGHAVVFLNGEIGGSGKIKLAGDIGGVTTRSTSWAAPMTSIASPGRC